MFQRCPVLYTCIILLTGFGEAIELPGYEHIPDLGWLRLHTVPATWAEARLRCNLEGDTLASPTTSVITASMKTTMIEQGMAQSSVFVDMHISYPFGVFVSVDGTPFSNISLEWAEGEPNNQNNQEDCLTMSGLGELADESCTSVLPYFCYKRNMIAVNRCFNADKGYLLTPRMDKCYKFHNKVLSWRHASMACAAEHAHLAVINSDEESQVLKKLFSDHPSSTIEGSFINDHAHIGFWDWNENNEWLTIFGQRLPDAGYNKWAVGQPSYIGKMSCGSMTRDALLSNDYCSTTLPFVCESHSQFQTFPKNRMLASNYSNEHL